MAVDEFLLYNCKKPILRIYGWSKPVFLWLLSKIDEVNLQKCNEKM